MEIITGSAASKKFQDYKFESCTQIVHCDYCNDEINNPVIVEDEGEGYEAEVGSFAILTNKFYCSKNCAELDA